MVKSDKFCMPVTSIIVFCLLTSISSFAQSSLYGVWTRVDDGLTIEIQYSQNEILSYVVKEGREKFPCGVRQLPIYRNITRKGKGWTCDFLVAEINEECKPEYGNGRILLTKSGEMEIVCPGLGKKLYVRKKPRYQKKL